jgi:uncharacterized protein (DUF2252 family)
VAGGSGKNGSKGAVMGCNVCQRQVYIATTKHAIIYKKQSVRNVNKKAANCHTTTLPATLSKSQNTATATYFTNV